MPLPEKNQDFPRLLRTQQDRVGLRLPLHEHDILQAVPRASFNKLLSWSIASGNRLPHQETLQRAHPLNTNKFLVVFCSFTLQSGKTFFVSLLSPLLWDAPKATGGQMSIPCTSSHLLTLPRINPYSPATHDARDPGFGVCPSLSQINLPPPVTVLAPEILMLYLFQEADPRY